MPDPNTLPLVRIADASGNPANPGGGSGTANPYPGSDYAKDTKQPVLVNGRVPIDGSQVTQPVSGTFFQTTQPVSAASLPLPTGAATDGSDPASPAVANAGSGPRGWLGTIAGLLKLGTQTKAQSGSVTIATDQGNIEPGGTAITGTTMPSGGVGLTGWLSAIWQAVFVKTQMYVEAASGSAIGASATVSGTTHDLGSLAVPYTKINVKAQLSVNGGTLYIDESNDGFTSTGYGAASVTMPNAGITYSLTVPITARYWKVRIVNGSTAGTVAGFTSSTSAA
jgi:hypothetical protein